MDKSTEDYEPLRWDYADKIDMGIAEAVWDILFRLVPRFIAYKIKLLRTNRSRVGLELELGMRNTRMIYNDDELPLPVRKHAKKANDRMYKASSYLGMGDTKELNWYRIEDE